MAYQLSHMTAPRRRWSFGIRTMLVLVALAAIPLSWAAYYFHWSAQRNDARRWLAENNRGFPYVWRGPCKIGVFPWPLKIIGEPQQQSPILCFNRGESPDEFRERLARLRRLFPESQIWDGHEWHMPTQPLGLADRLK